MMRISRAAVFVMGLSFAGVAASVAASGALADVIAERKAGFKGNAAALKTIKGVLGSDLGSGDFEAIAGAAESVADWSRRMVEYFPQGSDEGDTKARSEIWLNFDDFTAKAADAEKAALALAGLARSGDGAGVEAGFKTLAGTCKTCHNSYKD